jgi:hypothetical protein
VHRPAVVIISMSAAAGCGRIGFDAQTSTLGDGAGSNVIDGSKVCTAVGHDEDNDGVDDACDVCPHIPGPQADLDGDGVGDACDPEPAIGRQSIVLFDPFTSLANWTSMGATQAGDDAILDAINGSRELVRPYTPNNDLFMIGMTAGASGAGQYNFALVTAPISSPAGFYCEMFDTGGSFSTTMLTWTTDGTSYMHAGTNDWPAGQHFANGSGTFSYALTPTSCTCESIWNGVNHGGNGARPGIAVEEQHIYGENFVARLHWYIQIRTN